MTRRNPSYFFRIDTYWAGSPDRFIGPFSNREEADAALAACWQSDDYLIGTPAQPADNIKDAIRIRPEPMTMSGAKSAGMRDSFYGDTSSNVLPVFPKDTSYLMRLEAWREGYSID